MTRPKVETTMTPMRHTMVDFDPARRDAVAERLAAGLLPMHRLPEIEQRIRTVFVEAPIPGIVCAPKGPLAAGEIQLGVSFPFREDGVRVRAAVAVCGDAIAAVHSPWSLVDRLSPESFDGASDLLALVELGATHGIAVGFFGSAALQALTGLPYLEARSDIDAVVTAGSMAGLRDFHHDLAAFAGGCGRRLDVEVACPGGLGVKLSELVSDAATVLGRGLDGVRLVDRHRLVGEIDTLSPVVPVR